MVKNYDVFAWETIVSKFRPFLSGFSILRLIGFGNCVSISIFGKEKNRHSFVISKKSLSMKHEYVLRFTLQKCEIYVWGKPHFGIQNIHYPCTFFLKEWKINKLYASFRTPKMYFKLRSNLWFLNSVGSILGKRITVVISKKMSFHESWIYVFALICTTYLIL